MPLIKNPERIGKTQELLRTAALIMSFFLICSSLITSILIPAAEFEAGGKGTGASTCLYRSSIPGRRFWYGLRRQHDTDLLVCRCIGNGRPAEYSSKYLPRYGMAPNWARASRPLVIIFALICFAITIIFDADVEAQGGAYATGVLVLMASAAVAVTISAWTRSSFKMDISIHRTRLRLHHRYQHHRAARTVLRSHLCSYSASC